MNLKQLLHGHVNTLLERKSTKAILSDAFNNDIPTVNALMSAYDIGIVSLIEENYPLENLERSKAINKLTKQYSMLESKAEWAVDQWILTIDNLIIAELKAAREKAEDEDIKPDIDFILDDGLEMVYDSSLPVAIDFTEKAEQIDYYTNVTMRKIKGKIYIPCGVGNTDNGFYICGVREEKVSKAPAVFALVYNYLTRNSCIMPEDYPHYLNTVNTTYQINYQNVYRLMIIILQLIKNGLISRKININYDGKKEELDIAIAIINDYLARFSRIMRIKNIILEKVAPGRESIKVSLTQKVNGIYIEENKHPCNAREIWFGEKIKYRLDNDILPDLEYILSEISPFDTFKEGQFTALKNMLGTDDHSMCIMPTGSGKSLIFYFASILQPLPIFIIAPTEILIEDQIRNLKKFHHIDNVSHLKLTSENDFRDFEMRNSLLYLTPGTFQSRHLLARCRHINNGNTLIKHDKTKMLQEFKIAPGPSIAYVVLDEIHCLSNWGHDFRPEYLMLSKKLRQYLDRITFLGFTATANYTVVEDIQQQFKIPQRNIFSPIAFEKYNVEYHFTGLNSFDEMLECVCDVVESHIAKGERTIIFTKNDEVSYKVAEAIGYEADVFQKDNTFAYHLFADEKCKVLVASNDLGIGVNLPNIHNVVHFGLPISKNEFVQEIGRAGRANEAVNSYVFYLNPIESNIPAILLKRELEIANISDILNNIDNDYSDCYRKLNSNIDSKEDLLESVMYIYEEFGENIYAPKYPIDTVDNVKKLLFILYTLGYIRDWYAYSKDESEGVIQILIDVYNSNPEIYKGSPKMLQCVKQKSVAYYESLGSNREQIVKTQRASDVPSIIKIYVDWYYSKFLYHHKEMFLDFLEFAESNKANDSERITEDIREYFTLPFVEIKSDETYYSKLTLSEIADKIAQGIGKNTLANVERINSNRYVYNLDCFLFLGNLKLYNRFDNSRFERIIKNTSIRQEQELKSALEKVFAKLKSEGRFEIVRQLSKTMDLYGGNIVEICDSLYKNSDKDMVYYGVIANQLKDTFC